MAKKVIGLCILLIILVNTPFFSAEAVLMPALEKNVPGVYRDYNYIETYYDAAGNGSATVPIYKYTAPNGMVITEAYITLSGDTSSYARGTWCIYNSSGTQLASKYKSSERTHYFQDIPVYPNSQTISITFGSAQKYMPDYLEVESVKVVLSADVADNDNVNAAKAAAIDAKNAANAADTNATASKNMLNGSSNGGKSLAATYDKANSAQTNTAYIRMPHCFTILV